MLAFSLNFLLPGASLGYPGKASWKMVNLLAVLGIGVAMPLANSGKLKTEQNKEQSANVQPIRAASI